jgi:hypothetical protein
VVPEFPQSPDDLPEERDYEAEQLEADSLNDSGISRHKPFCHTPTSYADLKRICDAMSAPIHCGKQVSK